MGSAALANSLRSSVAPSSGQQRPTVLQSSGMPSTAGVGVMAAVGNLMSNPHYSNDSMAFDLDGCPPTAVLQGQAERAYAQQWILEEQKSLESGLVRWPAERHPPLEQYSRIATLLPRKGIRDVALRIQWMAKLTKRKQAQSMAFPSAEDLGRSSKRLNGQTIFSATSAVSDIGMGVPPFMHMGLPGLLPGPSMPMAPMDASPMQPMAGSLAAVSLPAAAPTLAIPLDNHGSGGVGSIGGPIDNLLDQNYTILNQFKANMAVYKVEENTLLLMRYRDNILSVLHRMQSMGGVMAEMPALPVRLNAELAANFLPTSGLAHTTPMDMQVMSMMPPNSPYSEAQPAAVPLVSDQLPAESDPGGILPPGSTRSAGAALRLGGSRSLPAGIPDLTRDSSTDMLLSQLPVESCDDLLGEPSISVTDALPPSEGRHSPAAAVSGGAASEQQLSHSLPLRSSSSSSRLAASQASQQQNQNQQVRGKQASVDMPSQPRQALTSSNSLCPVSLSAAATSARGALAARSLHVPLQQGQAAATDPSASGQTRSSAVEAHKTAPSRLLPVPGATPGASATSQPSSACRALPRLTRQPVRNSVVACHPGAAQGVISGARPPMGSSNPAVRSTSGPSIRPAVTLAARSALCISAPVMLPQARNHPRAVAAVVTGAAAAMQPVCSLPDQPQATISGAPACSAAMAAPLIRQTSAAAVGPSARSLCTSRSTNHTRGDLRPSLLMPAVSAGKPKFTEATETTVEPVQMS